MSPRLLFSRRSVALAVSFALAIAPRASAAEGVHLFFYGTEEHHRQEAVRLHKEAGDAGLEAEEPVQLSAEKILEKLEALGKARTRITSLTIISHGNQMGPLCAPGSRLTEDLVEAWVVKLGGPEVPRRLFTAGARITIRACYVGRGRLPRQLASILPPDGKVETDVGFYKSHTPTATGFWSLQRVSQREKDFTTYDRQQKPTFDYTGTWSSGGNGTIRLKQESGYSAEEEGIPDRFLGGQVEGTFRGTPQGKWGAEGGEIRGDPDNDESGKAIVDPTTGQLRAHIYFTDGEYAGKFADLTLDFHGTDGAVVSGHLEVYEGEGVENTRIRVSAKRAD